MKKDIVIYKTLEEAKQKTGYFNVHSIQITKELGNKILEYIQKEKIIVNSRYPKREKRSCHTLLRNLLYMSMIAVFI